jgi:hypothetical protein
VHVRLELTAGATAATDVLHNDRIAPICREPRVHLPVGNGLLSAVGCSDEDRRAGPVVCPAEPVRLICPGRRLHRVFRGRPAKFRGTRIREVVRGPPNVGARTGAIA